MKGNRYVRREGFYEIGGRSLPSVTTVIGEVLSKPGLNFWYGKVGLAEGRKISDEAMGFGTVLHKLISEYIRSGKGPIQGMFSDDVSKSWETWKDWWGRNRLKAEKVEEVIYTDSYAGTCDFFGEGVLIDWKFGNGIYDNYRVQAGAYGRVLGAERAKIVRVGRGQRNLEVVEMDQRELEEAAEVFDSLLKVFWWRRRNQ